MEETPSFTPGLVLLEVKIVLKRIICIPVFLSASGMLLGQQNIEGTHQKISSPPGGVEAVKAGSRAPAADLSVAHLRAIVQRKHDQLRSLRAEIVSTNPSETDLYSLYSVVAAKARSRMVLRKHQRGDDADPLEHLSIYDGKSFNVYYPYNRIYEVSQQYAREPYTDKVRSDTFFEILAWWPPDDPSTPPRLEGRSFFLKDLLVEPKCQVRPQQEVIQGHLCHVIEVPGLDRLWIDPQLGVVVRRERLTGDPPAAFVTYEFQDFKEVAAGLWLPFGATRILHTDGSRKTVHRVLSCEINDVADSTFSLTLQPETLVCDRDTDGSYQVAGKYDLLRIILDRVKIQLGDLAPRPIPYQTRASQFILCAAVGMSLYVFASIIPRLIRRPA